MHIVALLYVLLEGVFGSEILGCNQNLDFAYAWRQIPGKMKEISAALDGSVFAIDANDQVYRLVNGDTWENINPFFRLHKIAYYRDGSIPLDIGSPIMLYGVTACGKAYKLNIDEATFRHIPHTKELIDIAVGYLEELWVVDVDLQLYRLNINDKWDPITPGWSFNQTDVKSRGGVVAVHFYGYVFTYDAISDQWNFIPKPSTVNLIEAAITNDGYIYAIGTDHTIWYINVNEQTYTPICNKKAMSISAVRGRTNEIYIVDMDQNIYTTADPRIPPESCYMQFEFRSLSVWWRCGAPVSQCPNSVVCQTGCVWTLTEACHWHGYRKHKGNFCGLSMNYVCIYDPGLASAHSESSPMLDTNDIAVKKLNNIHDQYNYTNWTTLLSVVVAVVGMLINIVVGLSKCFVCDRFGCCKKEYEMVSHGIQSDAEEEEVDVKQ